MKIASYTNALKVATGNTVNMTLIMCDQNVDNFILIAPRIVFPPNLKSVFHGKRVGFLLYPITKPVL